MFLYKFVQTMTISKFVSSASTVSISHYLTSKEILRWNAPMFFLRILHNQSVSWSWEFFTTNVFPAISLSLSDVTGHVVTMEQFSLQNGKEFKMFYVNFCMCFETWSSHSICKCIMSHVLINIFKILQFKIPAALQSMTFLEL